MKLESKRAIVTGGASGIGRAICRVFAGEGAWVAIADIDEPGGSVTAELIAGDGGEAFFIPTDVSSAAAVEQLVRESADRMGGIDILVNDAAAFVFGRIEDVTPADWEKVFGVNVIGSARLRPVQLLQGRPAAVNPLPRAGSRRARYPCELRVSRINTYSSYGASHRI